jgi:hypothetical protein
VTDFAPGQAVIVVDLRRGETWPAVVVAPRDRDDRLIVKRDSDGRDYRVGASFVRPADPPQPAARASRRV